MSIVIEILEEAMESREQRIAQGAPVYPLAETYLDEIEDIQLAISNLKVLQNIISKI